MSSQLAKSALADVLPGSAPFAPQLVEYTLLLYRASQVRIATLGDLETARHHICAFIAAEAYRTKLQLPEPLSTRIPVPRGKLGQLMMDFKQAVGSPVKRMPQTPVGSPRSGRSPLTQRLVEAAGDSPRRARRSTAGSPFMDEAPGRRSPSRTSSPGLSPGASPFTSPIKRRVKDITRTDVVAVCNRFCLPALAARGVLRLFKNYCTRVKNEWVVLCGLIGLAYTRVFWRELASDPLLRERFVDRLVQLQHGGLEPAQVEEWIGLADALCGHERWVRDVEMALGYSQGRNRTSAGRMRTPSDYATWRANVLS